MSNKLLKSIPLLIGFLLLTQIAKGQISYLDTEKYGKQIIVPVGFMDTIIHDLKERKYLLQKDSLNTSLISILRTDLSAKQGNILEAEKSFITSDFKRRRNGWQRNFFIFTNIALAYFLIK